MSLKYTWIKNNIDSFTDANRFVDILKTTQPTVGAFDTETTGLHIILDTPFLYQFGFLHPTKEIGYTFVVDLQQKPKLAKKVIALWHEYCKTNLKVYLGHNVKFDLHMCQNIGLPYTTENVSDTMFYIRAAHDAVQQKNGGPPMGLKDYSARYIDRGAKRRENVLKKERASIAKELNNKLRIRLANATNCRTLAMLKDLFKDPIVSIEDLPENIKEVYKTWLIEDVPERIRDKVTQLIDSDIVPYDILNRGHVKDYAHYDIIYTLEIYLKTKPIIEARKTEDTIIKENLLIMPLVEMERVGFDIDKEYLIQARKDLKDYILKTRKHFKELAGEDVAVGQHAKIKQIFLQRFNENVESTGKDVIELLESNAIINYGADAPIVDFIKTIEELRTLEKWYATYITRFLIDLKNTNRLYTSINQVGAVSGRVSSNFQQFPSQAIKTRDGVEIFNPRRMVKVSKGYRGICYLDYSQIELRFQAFYTILVGHPDLNLCRAYMPYKCVTKDGVQFDYTNPEHIKNWKQGWFFEENPEKPWVATDVHGATTEKATGLTPADEGFAKARKTIGKRVNFAKNYGAKLNKIRTMFPEKTMEEVKRIDGAYYAAFPGVKHYHDYCYARATCSFTGNLFGIKYYNVDGHKLINMLVQGSAAYFLKWKIRELYDYCKAHNVKSRWQMQIHDELSWEMHPDDPPEVFLEFKRIMEDWDESFVPIVADMEITTTNWAEKKEVNNFNELKSYFSD